MGTIYVGIDVSKAQWDVAERPSGNGATVPHTPAGIAELVERLRSVEPAGIVVEATGGLEVPLASALASAGLPVHVVNPRQVRDFAKALGRLAKTDTLDAQVLAQFAEVVRPAPRSLPDAATQALSALLTRRRQLIEMRTAEQNRLGTAPRSIRRQIRAHLTWLNRQLIAVDTDLASQIRATPVWREREDLWRTVPGIGPVTSRTLLAELPELPGSVVSFHRGFAAVVTAEHPGGLVRNGAKLFRVAPVTRIVFRDCTPDAVEVALIQPWSDAVRGLTVGWSVPQLEIGRAHV